MAPAAIAGQLSARRAALAGPVGMKGLFHNGRTTSIALFAALGGLVYGCMFLGSLSLAPDSPPLSRPSLTVRQTIKECSVKS